MFVLPLVLLGVLELALRVAGYGYSTHFFRKMTIAGQACLVENPQFSRLFFPPALARTPAPFTMRAKKPAGTFRIFVFGESAAEGDPRPQAAASRYLQALLEGRFPAQHFEIINTGITAINSHAILPIARECAALDGDFWVIYMGNNEMVGPYGAATVFGGRGTPASLVRLGLAVKRLRVGQLLVAAAAKLRPGHSQLSQWRGMEMFLRNKVPPGDNRRDVVYDNFRRNLNDILRAGTASGARIVLSTVAVNLRDCPPFASEDPQTLREPDRSAYEKCWSDAEAARRRHDFAQALPLYTKAAELFPQSAEAQYELAVCLARLTNFTLARKHFELACDDDTLPFRSDSRLRALVQDAASRFAPKGVVLCNAAALLAARSPGGVSGREFFYEHVHPNFAGNYELGLAWAEEIAKLLPSRATVSSGAWPSPAQCERRLGLTDWNRVSVLEDVIARLHEPPFSTQSDNSNRIAKLEHEVSLLRDQMTAPAAAAARALYTEALQRAPNDYMVHGNFAEFLEATGDLKEAAAQRRRVTELTPQDYFCYLKLGRVLREEREFQAAEMALREAARLKPDQEEVRLDLGAACALQKKYDLAVQEFERARQLAPGDPRPLVFTAEALWRMNRARESVGLLREAIRLKPDYVDAHYQLGEQLALTHDLEGAMAEFQEVLRWKPDHLRARLNLGVALARLGQTQEALKQCDQALRLAPGNQQALDLRRQLLGQEPKR